MSALSTPGQVMAWLDAIAQDLGERQNEYERAADDRARLTRDWDKRFAIHMKVAPGTNAEKRKANALVAAIEQDDLYERLTDAEARFEAMKAAITTMDKRSTIGQSILKAQGRG